MRLSNRCTLRFAIKICAADLSVWVCTLTGEHVPRAVAGVAPPLSLSPLVGPSLWIWVGGGDEIRFLHPLIEFPDGMAAMFGDAFMARISPTLAQAGNIVAHRKGLLKRRGDLEHMATAPRRVARRQVEAEEEDENGAESCGEEAAEKRNR